MNKIGILILALFLTACSTMTPPRYSVSVDNVMKLKKIKGKGYVQALTTPEKLNLSCRMMGPIEPADGLSVGEFVAKAMNDELKMAEVYSQSGKKLSGEITEVSFSSTKGLTGGYWDLAMNLKSNNGKSLRIKTHYEFKSGFDAVTACNATADALSNAVQELIGEAVSKKEFSTLFK